MLPDPLSTIELDVFKCSDLLSASSPPLLIDCREIQEYEHCKIANSVLVPLSNFAVILKSIEYSQNLPIIVYCHHGVRSLYAVHYLRDAGFNKSFSMAGGIDQWSVLIDSAIQRY